MTLTNCISCGNCMDFKCPVGAFKFKFKTSYGTKTHHYGSAEIDSDKCTDCGLCKQIDCLGECIK